MFTHRDQEIKLVTDNLVRGYCWIYGIHGIGKTALVRRCMDDLKGYTIKYIDCRTEAYGYPNLICMLISQFGQKYTQDEHENHQLFRSLFYDPSYKHLRFVLDEMDVYPPSIVRPAWKSLMGLDRQVGIAYISARSVEYFDEYDLSSRDAEGELDLDPLPIEAAYQYFKNKEVPRSYIGDFVKLSGGNPTLMKWLGQMYHTSKDPNVFGKVNKHFLTMISTYFSNVWNALEEDIKTYCLFAAILFFNYANQTKYWYQLRDKIDYWSMRKLESRLRSMFSFGDTLPSFLSGPRVELPAVISPLFITWLLTEKTSHIDKSLVVDYDGPNPITVQSDKVFGLPLSAWQDAGKAIETIGSAASVFQTIVSIFK